MVVRAGDRVEHPQYGPGRVLSVRVGRRVRVRFDREPDLPRTVLLRELLAGDGQKGRPRPPPEPLSLDPERARLRQVIEALRLGVVPDHHVADYTVGREGAIRRLEELLAARQGMELLFGDYGAGKTHLLDLFEQEGRRRGFLTARVILDPQEVPLSHPQRLWRAILRSLRYPDEAGEGLVPILARLHGSRQHLSPAGPRFSRFLSPVLFAHGQGDEELWGWALDYIEGYRMDPYDVKRAFRRGGWPGPDPLALSDFRTYGRVYVHLVGTLATWGCDAGYGGLLLLLDEAEQVDAFDREHRELAREVLGHYAAATLPRRALGFDPESLYKGGHAVHRALPLRFHRDQPLVVVAALTPLPEIQFLARSLVPDLGLHLKPLGPRELAELMEKVTALYRRAYPEAELSPPGLRLHDFETPRQLIRAVVAHLDQARLGAPVP